MNDTRPDFARESRRRSRWPGLKRLGRWIWEDITSTEFIAGWAVSTALIGFGWWLGRRGRRQ